MPGYWQNPERALIDEPLIAALRQVGLGQSAAYRLLATLSAKERLRIVEGLLASQGGSLDHAWAEVEAVLPEGEWTWSVSRTSHVASGPYVAVTDYGDPRNAYAYADTPAAALLALAEKLRATR